MIKLIWIDRKYSKSSFQKNIAIGTVLQIFETINPNDRKIIPATQKENILGVFRGNGIVRTYGKTKVLYEKQAT